MKNETIYAIYKSPGHEAYETFVPNTLEGLQSIVGGYIETVTFADDMVVICNEEGRLLGLPHNCSICGVDFCGPILLVGIKGDSFCDFPLDNFEDAVRLFPSLLDVSSETEEA